MKAREIYLDQFCGVDGHFVLKRTFSNKNFKVGKRTYNLGAVELFWR